MSVDTSLPAARIWFVSELIALTSTPGSKSINGVESQTFVSSGTPHDTNLYRYHRSGLDVACRIDVVSQQLHSLTRQPCSSTRLWTKRLEKPHNDHSKTSRSLRPQCALSGFFTKPRPHVPGGTGFFVNAPVRSSPSKLPRATRSDVSRSMHSISLVSGRYRHANATLSITSRPAFSSCCKMDGKSASRQDIRTHCKVLDTLCNFFWPQTLVSCSCHLRQIHLQRQ